MWYNYVVRKVFEKLYDAYSYPFTRSDRKIALMPDAERKEYFRQAKDLLENRAYRQEFEDLTRRFYQELAVKTTSNDEMLAYRLTLKMIQEFDKRFQSLARMYTPNVPKDLSKLNKL